VGWIFVVSSVEAQYLRPARLDDLLSVHAEIQQASRASLLFAQRVDRDGETLLRATVRVACVDQLDFKPRRLPAELLQRLAADSP